MAIVRYVPENGHWRLEYPIGRVLLDGIAWISHPEFPLTANGLLSSITRLRAATTVVPSRSLVLMEKRKNLPADPFLLKA